MMSTLPTISPQERDALYQLILTRLTGINDVYQAIEAEDFDAADRLSSEFADYLRLLHEDLGWGQRNEAIELKTPPDVLRRALSRLRERAEIEDREELEERDELAKQALRNQLIREACSHLLEELDEI
jgi:hypothetical protein